MHYASLYAMNRLFGANPRLQKFKFKLAPQSHNITGGGLINSRNIYQEYMCISKYVVIELIRMGHLQGAMPTRSQAAIFLRMIIPDWNRATVLTQLTQPAAQSFLDQW